MSKKRIMSWILIVFFVSGVLFSYGYIARNVEHDCKIGRASCRERV